MKDEHEYERFYVEDTQRGVDGRCIIVTGGSPTAEGDLLGSVSSNDILALVEKRHSVYKKAMLVGLISPIVEALSDTEFDLVSDVVYRLYDYIDDPSENPFKEYIDIVSACNTAAEIKLLRSWMHSGEYEDPIDTVCDIDYPGQTWGCWVEEMSLKNLIGYITDKINGHMNELTSDLIEDLSKLQGENL